jgi:6-phosphogluconolactonase
MRGARLDILADPQSVARRAAEWITEQIALTSEVFRIALSGGSTPRLLYQELASPEYRDRIEWRRVELFWGDERFVPHSDERSNYRMARETLLAHAPVLIDHIHPVPTEGDPESAAERYEATLKGVYGADVLDHSRPLFQLILLGLGEDGHTASLFPGNVVLKERSRWFAAVENRDEPRLTLTYPAIQSSHAVAFVVVGEDRSLPATRVRSDGEIVWFLDHAAASRLPLHDTA